jgi:hypothetical protein
MKVFRKGIIRDIPLDCSMDEIKGELNKSNPDRGIQAEKKSGGGWIY